MATSVSLFSGPSRFSTVPSGKAARASSDGGKDGERPLAFQDVDEFGGLNGGDQGLERADGHAGVDDVGGSYSRRSEGERQAQKLTSVRV